ncbi:MAG TPA: ATP-binding protein [Terracidiphilus sp.]|nr:ATP-binding protein [Terracidiphilus sp.]
MHATLPIERIEAQLFRRLQIVFCVLTLLVLAALLLLHAVFTPLLGKPSRAVILVLIFSFLLKTGETIWLQEKQEGISARTARIETVISVAATFSIAGLLAFLTNRDDCPYFVLLAIPILQSAYHLGLVPAIATIGTSIGMMFAWITHYFGVHPPVRSSEYLESGMIAVIFCIMGPLVWFLVDRLKAKESILYEKMFELEAVRERLVTEERLAAVGRFASGIAHEIRNPVAMITSSLDTATCPSVGTTEKDEMYSIAVREAKRLENFTTDFLAYARPSTPRYSMIEVGDIAHYIADVTKMRAADHSISVSFEPSDATLAEVDAAQIESALLNLSLNALDATPSGGRVILRTSCDQSAVYVEVENSGKMIPDSNLARIFEPFFTTKSKGTGLGLAIARGIAIAHGGDLWVSGNSDGAVVFTMAVRKRTSGPSVTEVRNGQNSNGRR